MTGRELIIWILEHKAENLEIFTNNDEWLMPIDPSKIKRVKGGLTVPTDPMAMGADCTQEYDTDSELKEALELFDEGELRVLKKYVVV